MGRGFAAAFRHSQPTVARLADGRGCHLCPL